MTDRVIIMASLTDEHCRRQQVSNPKQSDHGFETRSSPASLAVTRSGFTFYVTNPIGSIHGFTDEKHSFFLIRAIRVIRGS